MKAISSWFLHCILFIILISIGSAMASDLTARTSIRKTELQEHRARVYSESTEEAIAAVETGLNSSDSELRSITLESALKNSSIRVQTTALRWLFSGRNRIIFTVLEPDGGGNGSKHTYDLWKGFVLNDFKLNRANDEIEAGRQSNPGYQGGQIIRGGFQLKFAWYPDRVGGYRCAFEAQVDKESFAQEKIQLKGDIKCIFPPLDNHAAKGDTNGSVAFLIKLS